MSGSQVVCTYPNLIAAYHVLHRLIEPRHPPFALAFFFFFREIIVVTHYKQQRVPYYNYIVNLIVFARKNDTKEIKFNLFSSLLLHFYQYVKEHLRSTDSRTD